MQYTNFLLRFELKTVVFFINSPCRNPGAPWGDIMEQKSPVHTYFSKVTEHVSEVVLYLNRFSEMLWQNEEVDQSFCIVTVLKLKTKT